MLMMWFFLTKNSNFFFAANFSPFDFISNCIFSGYVVEKFDPTKGTWEKVSSSVTGTKLAVKNLQEGHEYKFRVKAENLHGLSEPLETEKPIVAKNPFSKYWDIYKCAEESTY